MHNKDDNPSECNYSSGIVVFFLCGIGSGMLKLQYIHSNAWDGD